jgi:sulfoxide reductase heme-binding subunit YedZ
MSQALTQHVWWLASRASGVVALGLVTISVVLGLMMAGKLSRRPGAGRALSAIHEQTAVTGLLAISVHGLTLLGDPWLNPGPAGIAIPFTMAYRTLWVGLGITAGWLATLLGLSFYARRRIGARLWRRAHKATIVVYVLGVAHTLGAGTDASSAWLFWPVVATIPVVALLFGARAVHGIRRGRTRAVTVEIPPRHRRPEIEEAAVA